MRYHIQVQLLTGHVLTHRIARQTTRSMNWPLVIFWGYSPTFNVYFNLILSLLRFMIADAAWSQTKSPILGALGDDSSQMKCLLVPLWWLITALILSSLFLLLVGEETAKTTLNSMFRWLEHTSGSFRCQQMKSADWMTLLTQNSWSLQLWWLT